MKHKIIICRGVVWVHQLDTQRRGQPRPRWVYIHELEPLKWKEPQQGGECAAHHAGAYDGRPITDPRPGVPERVDCGLHCARQHGAIARHIVGHWGQRARRHHVTILVWVEAEYPPALQRRWPLLHCPDREISVLDRARPASDLERGTHRAADLFRDAAGMNQHLGAATDPGADRAYQRLALAWTSSRFGPQYAVPGGHRPVRRPAFGRHVVHCHPCSELLAHRALNPPSSSSLAEEECQNDPRGRTL